MTDWAKKALEFLDYNTATGEFKWKKSPSRNVKAGSVAGSFDKDGYRRIQIHGAGIKAHRLAWLMFYGEMPKRQIDHINGDKVDNRIMNLRDVSVRTNTANRKRNRETGLVGVKHHKGCPHRPYEAKIRVGKRTETIGFFRTAEEATAAYRTRADAIERGEG